MCVQFNQLLYCLCDPYFIQFLIEVAREKNSTPLPLIPEKFGPRLPPERYCLTANNYKLEEKHKPVSCKN